MKQSKIKNFPNFVGKHDFQLVQMLKSIDDRTFFADRKHMHNSIIIIITDCKKRMPVLGISRMPKLCCPDLAEITLTVNWFTIWNVDCWGLTADARLFFLRNAWAVRWDPLYIMSYKDQMINVNFKPIQTDNQRFSTENLFLFYKLVRDSVIVRIY